MSNQTKSPWLWLPIAFIAGVVLAFAMVPVIARTSAIAAPVSFFAWFESVGLVSLGALVWDTFVVFGLSIFLPAVVALLVLFRLLPKHRIAAAGCLMFGVFLSLYVLTPVYFGAPVFSPLVFPWWQQGLSVSVMLAFLIALGLSRFARVVTGAGLDRSNLIQASGQRKRR